MKSRKLLTFLILLLLLTVSLWSCNESDTPDGTDSTNTEETSGDESTSDHEEASSNGSDTEETTDTDSDESESITDDPSDDLYPNVAEDGHTKRY